MRTIVITGASDGIGAAAARRLHADGHRVVVVGRTPEKTRGLAGDLGVEHHVADFARLDDVRALAATLAERHERIDVLANNAGGLFGERTLTVDGFEKTLQVNHLAPFLLTALLMDTLLASGATVVNTSSVAAKAFARLDLDDLGNERAYHPRRAYGDSKLANILHARELQRRFGPRGLNAASFHPGGVATNFANDTTSRMRFAYHTPSAGSSSRRSRARRPWYGSPGACRDATGRRGSTSRRSAWHGRTRGPPTRSWPVSCGSGAPRWWGCRPDMPRGRLGSGRAVSLS